MSVPDARWRWSELFARIAAVVLVHWIVGAALGLDVRPLLFDVLAMACPALALLWLAVPLAPSSDRRALRACALVSGAGLVALTIVAALTWSAGDRPGAPEFVSPVVFGARWLALF